MENVRIGKFTYRRKFAVTVATAGCVILAAFASFADMVSDSPMVSGGQVVSVETTASGNASQGPLISDSPMVMIPETREITEITPMETTAAQSVNMQPETKSQGVVETLPDLRPESETKGAKVEETLPALQSETEKRTVPETVSVTIPVISAVSETQGAKIEETLPALATEQATAEKDNAAIAELPQISQPETTSGAALSITAAPSIETKATANVSAPQVRNVSSDEAGSSHANDSVTRIYLDFSLITPSHKYGSSNVARASVRLSDGTWQKFEYKEHIRYPFYKMISQDTDSDGESCYVAAAHARRFGDSTTDDGEMKTELYLKASDCTVRNYLDISTTNQKRIAIVKAALSMLGKQYVYGGNGPDAFDCSGLVKNVMAEAGISVPRTSTQLLSMDGQISASELRPGDIMARAGHCGIYIGNGIFVHASDSSVGVIAEYLSVYNQVNKFTNCINVVGD